MGKSRSLFRSIMTIMLAQRYYVKRAGAKLGVFWPILPQKPLMQVNGRAVGKVTPPPPPETQFRRDRQG